MLVILQFIVRNDKSKVTVFSEFPPFTEETRNK